MDISMEGRKLVFAPESDHDAEQILEWFEFLKDGGDKPDVSFAVAERRRTFTAECINRPSAMR